MKRRKAMLTCVGMLLLLVAAGPLAAQDEAPTRVFVTNVNVWDGKGKDVVQADVLIENNLIKEVGSNLKAPKGATTIDGKGGTLTPGLIDMHTHVMLNGPKGVRTSVQDYDAFTTGAFALQDMNILMDQGFTSIREIAGNSLGLAKAKKAGLIKGPRIWSSGPPFSSTGGHGDITGWNQLPHEKTQPQLLMNFPTSDGVDAVIAQARWNFRHGAAFLKIMAGGGVATEYDPLEIIEYTQAEMEAIVAVAEDNKTYVTIHAYRDDAINRALDAGVKCVEHAFLVSEETIKRMKRENIVLSLQGYVSVVSFANPEEITFFNAEQQRKAKQVHEGALQMIAWARKHGLFIVSGSDMFGELTPDVIKNLTVEAELGFEPWEIMQHATYNAGKVLAMSGPARNPYREGPIGVIEPGAYADVIIWKESPLEDINNLEVKGNIKLMIQDGDVLKNTLN